MKEEQLLIISNMGLYIYSNLLWREWENCTAEQQISITTAKPILFLSYKAKSRPIDIKNSVSENTEISK